MPGHAKDSITVTIGYGRERAGRIGNGIGFNAYALRGSSALVLRRGDHRAHR